MDYFLDEHRLENAPAPSYRAIGTAPGTSDATIPRPGVVSHKCAAQLAIPTEAKRSGEPALSEVEGDLVLQPFASSQDPAEISKEFMGHDLDAKALGARNDRILTDYRQITALTRLPGIVTGVGFNLHTTNATSLRLSEMQCISTNR